MKNWEQALAGELERRWTLYRRALKHCQETFSERSIHSSRIEARRLAAQLDLHRVFAPRRKVEAAQVILRHHLHTFNPLRDAQVQLHLLKCECDGMPGAKAIRKLTIKREKRCRRAAKRRMRKVKTRPIKSVIHVLVERLREHGKDPEWMRLDRMTIIRTLETAFTNVVECRPPMQAADAASIHRMRIAFKKFRYMMESTRPLLPGITPARIAAMKAFQDLMGDLQDTDAFLARLDKLIAKKRLPAAKAAHLRRWLVRRQVHQVKRCVRRMDVMFKFSPQNFKVKKG